MTIEGLGFDSDEIAKAPLKAKIQAAKDVVKDAFHKNSVHDTVIGFTGGKDSTLTAWIVKQVCESEGLDKPRFMFVDHGDHFSDQLDFVNRLADQWGFEVVVVRNDDFIDSAGEIGETVGKSELADFNQDALDVIGKDEATFMLDTEAGNHLLKTVPMQRFIEDEDVKMVINGVRWDEHESRSDETFFSPRSDPDHVRVHPILMFDEEDVWDATWNHLVPDTVSSVSTGFGMPKSESVLPEGVGVGDLPVNKKYWSGFRSLGGETGTDASDDVPAWVQDLEDSSERGGRAQNKDDDEIMRRLREAGYM